MKLTNTFLLTICILIIFSCANRNTTSSNKINQKNVEAVWKLMTGEFSSEQQSKEDSAFYNINLVMHPIWETETEAKWLYVEQAVSSNLGKPYRQRIYKITSTENGTVESAVFLLPEPEAYIHAWDKPDLFKKITPASLTVREGCSVFLKRKGKCYTGSTKEKECTSSLYGASYATSSVTVCTDEVVSWDQGWDTNDKQVWGAETGGYIFKRSLGK